MRRLETEHTTSNYIIHGFCAEEKRKNAPNRRNKADKKREKQGDGSEGRWSKGGHWTSSIIQENSVKKALIFRGRYE